MDDCRTFVEPQDSRDVLTALPGDLCDIGCVVGDQSAREFMPVGADQGHGVAAAESTFGRGDSRGQETTSTLADRLGRAGVAKEATAWFAGKGDPMFPSRDPISPGEDERSLAAPGIERPQKSPRSAAVGDEGGNPSLRCTAGCLELDRKSVV